MPSIQDKVQVLLKWCADNSIIIDERIRIGTDNQTGIIVVCSEDDYIHPQTTLVKIPKTAVISARSCSLADVIPEAPYGLAAQLSLSLALYAEILNGTESRWHGYIQSFPEGIVDLPSFWDLRLEENISGPSQQGGSKGSIFLRGTEAGKICNGRLENGRTKLEEVTRFYCEVAGPLLLRNVNVWHNNESDHPTLLGFYRAFSLVSSRAFLVDAYHGLAMVPIADAFNHVLENHVHLESDYNVCPECGSLQECPHDRDEGPSGPVVRIPSDEHDLYYEMISNIAISPHTEIFNTYGEDLTNAQLLNQYGFILDVNENDRLFWTMDDVLETLAFGQTTTGSVYDSHRQRLAQDLRVISPYILGREPIFGQSQLVYHEALGENVFCLNSDGIMSHHLWFALFVLSVWRNFPNGKRLELDVAQMARSIMELQTELELKFLEDDGEDMDDDDARHARKPIGKVPADHRIPLLLHDIARFAVQLCGTRKATSGPEGFSAEQLSDIIDAEAAGGGDDCTTPTRAGLAISVLLGEWSILDSCEAAWTALLDPLRVLLDSNSDASS